MRRMILALSVWVACAVPAWAGWVLHPSQADVPLRVGQYYGTQTGEIVYVSGTATLSSGDPVFILENVNKRWCPRFGVCGVPTFLTARDLGLAPATQEP